MKKFEFKKTYEEVEIAGKVFRIDLNDDKVNEILAYFDDEYYGLYDRPGTRNFLLLVYRVENGKLMRWQKGKGPIKVWVSDGLQLPRGFVGPELDTNKCKTLYEMFNRPSFFRQLETVVHYVPQYRDMVKNGINDWGWVASEGIVSFEFVEDPTKADVLYFWCPESGAGSVGRTFYPWTRTPNARCIVHIETEYLRKWGSRVPTELRKTSAHEFGHVLGLTQHSSNIDDLMSGQGKTVSYREMTSFSSNTAVTKNDYATLRALYELPPGDLYTTLGR